MTRRTGRPLKNATDGPRRAVTVYLPALMVVDLDASLDTSATPAETRSDAITEAVRVELAHRQAAAAAAAEPGATAPSEGKTSD